MLCTFITKVAGYLLLVAFLAGPWALASPVERSAPTCTVSYHYLKLKSPGGVPYGTCCSNPLARAIWKDDRPACFIAPAVTERAGNVNSCPAGSNRLKKGDLAVCIYPPVMAKRGSTCPAANNYRILKAADGTPFGTCCPNNLPGAVWKNGMPVCSLSVSFTTPATSVTTCESGSYRATKNRLTVCIYRPGMSIRDDHEDSLSVGEICPGFSNWSVVEHNHARWGTCCDLTTDGVKWDKSRGPQCCHGKECGTEAESVTGCPTGWEKRSLVWMGVNLSVCREN